MDLDFNEMKKKELECNEQIWNEFLNSAPPPEIFECVTTLNTENPDIKYINIDIDGILKKVNGSFSSLKVTIEKDLGLIENDVAISTYPEFDYENVNIQMDGYISKISLKYKEDKDKDHWILAFNFPQLNIFKVDLYLEFIRIYIKRTYMTCEAGSFPLVMDLYKNK